MDHIAIDLGGNQSYVCVRKADGTILKKSEVPTAAIPRFLQMQPKSRVVVETCSEAFAVADAATAHGHEVRVVPATLAPSLLNVGARRTKRDELDAENISLASCRLDLGSVHVPSQESRDLKTMCGMREALVGARTMLINNVRGWLRQQMKRIRSGSTEKFPQRVRELGTLPSYVERQLVTIEQLSVQIVQAETEAKKKAASDAVCVRMMTVPGVGPMTSLRFKAALDTPSRFPSAHRVESYLGLVPGEHSSGERNHKLSITKAGSRHVRWMLIQAAWAARRAAKNHPMVAWSLKIEQKRGRHIAVVALSRKIAGILYAIWRDGTTYDPLHVARPSTRA